MRSKEHIWREGTEFLLKEYDAAWGSIIDTYSRNESWFKFLITFLALVIGILGVTFKIGETNEYVWGMLSVFLLLLIMVGLGTLHILIHNRRIIVEYLNVINRIRAFFVDRVAENVEPKFRGCVLLPTTDRDYFKPDSVNFVLVYIVFLFNLVTFTGLLLVYFEKVNCIIRSGTSSLFSLVVVAVIVVAFVVVNFVIFRKAYKHSKELKTQLANRLQGSELNRH